MCKPRSSVVEIVFFFKEATSAENAINTEKTLQKGSFPERVVASLMFSAGVQGCVPPKRIFLSARRKVVRPRCFSDVPRFADN